MIFNTWSFAIFGFAAVAVYWTVIPIGWRRQYLVLAGTAFYAFSVPAYLVLILGLGVVSYAVSSALIAERRPDRRKALLMAGVALTVAVLIWFKYSGFFAKTVNVIARHDVLPVPHLIVPLAISFFTFEFAHVMVDAYVGKLERLTPLDFAVFTMFFPTLVAGPIKRYQSFAPQLHPVRLPEPTEAGLYLYRILIGLMKKTIIADSMTALTVPLLSPDAALFGRLDYLLSILAYTAKIYFDFTGYSDIAIGISGLLGLKIPENFNRPYWSPNIGVFWRRWHISLSSWIRDYIFIPLGGSRRPPLVTALNLFLAMAIAGLWHGAAWTFIVWGLWHGAGLAIHRLWGVTVVSRVPWLRRPSSLVLGVSTITTFAFVALGWALFAAPTFSAAATAVQRAAAGPLP